MRPVFIVALVSTLLLAGYLSIQEAPEAAPEQEVLYVPDSVVQFVCGRLETRYSEVDCEDAPTPILILTEAPKMLGAAGMYVSGEPHVLIDPTSPARASALLHEVAHFLIYELGLGLDRCESEAAAMYVTGEEFNGWQEQYNCAVIKPPRDIET